MATNLRLRSDAEAALRLEAERTGTSQQEIIRTAIDQFLGLGTNSDRRRDNDVLKASGAVPPHVPYARPARRLVLPAHMTTTDLLDREDRL